MPKKSKIRLEVRVSGMAARELYEKMSNHISDSGVFLELTKSETRLRTVEPSVLVAVVTASATTLMALITSIFAVVKQRESKRIVIRGKSGESIEFPVNTTNERINELLGVLREMERPRIYVTDE